jgi:hypothetical protein
MALSSKVGFAAAAAAAAVAMWLMTHDICMPSAGRMSQVGGSWSSSRRCVGREGGHSRRVFILRFCMSMALLLLLLSPPAGYPTPTSEQTDHYSTVLPMLA